MAKDERGFASMDRNKRREISCKGGRAAHSMGTAHQWTREEARQAGRKGGTARHRKQNVQLGQDSVPEQRASDPIPDIVAW